MRDFELAVSELLDQYRNKIPRGEAADALLIQYNLVGADDTWKDTPDAETESAEAPVAEAAPGVGAEELADAESAAATEQFTKGPTEG